MTDVINKILELGYLVHPLKGDKTPVINKWPEVASNSPPEEWDLTCYGIKAEGLIIIDVDVKRGKRGAESLQTLIRHGLSRDTMIVKTPSGGLHLYYRSDVAVKNSVDVVIDGNKLDGIDIRSGNGYVVGPGSRVPMGTYEVHGKLMAPNQLPRLPESIEKQLVVHKKKITVRDASEIITSGADMPDVIRRGTRDETLVGLMAKWRGQGKSIEESKILLKEMIGRCEGQLDHDEYYEKLERAYDVLECNISDAKKYLLENLVYIRNGDLVADINSNNIVKVPHARNYYKNLLVSVETDSGQNKKEAFVQWMSDPKRLEADDVGYKPVTDKIINCGVNIGKTLYNRYRRPKSIDIGDNGTHEWFEELVRFLWQENSDTILDVCAHIIQRPHVKLDWAVFLVTPKEGMGKDSFYKSLSRMVGQLNASMIEVDKFIKTFNAFLENNHVLLVNELETQTKQNSRIVMSKLKTFITGDIQTIERKGLSTYLGETFTNFFMFSNSDDSLDIDFDVRRFFVHINREEPQSATWYVNLYRHIDNPVDIQATRNWLLERDISRFSSKGRAPHTEYKEELANNVRNEVEERILQDIDLHRSIFASDIISRSAFDFYISKVLPKNYRVSSAQARYIKKKYFQPIYTYSGTKKGPAKQFRLCTIYSNDSDPLDISRGDNMEKITVSSCRNHEKYIHAESQVIKDEYEKMFEPQLKPTMKLVK